MHLWDHNPVIYERRINVDGIGTWNQKARMRKRATPQYQNCYRHFAVYDWYPPLANLIIISSSEENPSSENSFMLKSQQQIVN